MSIDSQIKEMLELAKREKLDVEEVKQESFSAKQSGKRPVYNELLEGIEKDKFNAILTWAPDRLSRNAGDLGSLVDLMDRGKLAQIRTFSQTFSNNPNEKFLLMILCSQAKLENDNRGININRGMRAKCEMGWRPGVAPIGYMNRHFGGVKDIMVDPDRGPLIQEVFKKAAYYDWSGRRLKTWADQNGLSNRSGKPIALSQIFLILNNRFYYGEFEYPEGSGKVYKGSHEPLISKELFDLVQKSRSIPQKSKYGSKQFAFKGIFKCANCGSDITAEEKFKPLQKGGFNRHVYYHCTRQVNYSCKEPYINEKRMIDQLIAFISKNEGKFEVTPTLTAQSQRHAAIVRSTLESQNIKLAVKPLYEYAKFILQNGTYTEMAELVKGIKGQFQIKSRQIVL